MYDYTKICTAKAEDHWYKWIRVRANCVVQSLGLDTCGELENSVLIPSGIKFIKFHLYLHLQVYWCGDWDPWEPSVYVQTIIMIELGLKRWEKIRLFSWIALATTLVALSLFSLLVALQKLDLSGGACLFNVRRTRSLPGTCYFAN